MRVCSAAASTAADLADGVLRRHHDRTGAERLVIDPRARTSARRKSRAAPKVSSAGLTSSDAGASPPRGRPCRNTSCAAYAPRVGRLRATGVGGKRGEDRLAIAAFVGQQPDSHAGSSGAAPAAASRASARSPPASARRPARDAARSGTAPAPVADRAPRLGIACSRIGRQAADRRRQRLPVGIAGRPGDQRPCFVGQRFRQQAGMTGVAHPQLGRVDGKWLSPSSDRNSGNPRCGTSFSQQMRSRTRRTAR